MILYQISPTVGDVQYSVCDLFIDLRLGMFKVDLEEMIDYGPVVTPPNSMIKSSPTGVTATTISSLGSALIFLRGSSKEDPWSPSKNKTHFRWNTTDGVEIQTLPVTNENAHAVVAAYCVLFAIAAVGNVSVFASLLRRRHRKSRVSLLIKHLAAADLIVTFIMIPLEIGWRMTSQWLAGNAACKFFLLLRAFGLYLSSNVLVCISLDRYFAVVYPLKVKDTRRRGKIMLTFAWLTALLCSIPQSVVFHVLAHPEVPNFYQCVTFGFFETRRQEVAYNLFCLLAMYFIPLLVISFAYSRIFCVIASKSRIDSDQGGRQADPGEQFRGRVLLRRSDISNIERARARTLRMTITIVAAFVWCWTPYVLMTMWYMFDRESAQKVDGRVQDAFFIMAVSNSCMNPLLYGSYSTNFWRECNRRFSKILKNNQHYQNSSPENSLPTLSMESSGTNS